MMSEAGDVSRSGPSWSETALILGESLRLLSQVESATSCPRQESNLRHPV
jgi:hypothetical protein